MLFLCWLTFVASGVFQGRRCHWQSSVLLTEMQPYDVRTTTADAVMVCALSAMATSAAACANEPVGGLLIGVVVGSALSAKRVMLQFSPQSWAAVTVDLAMASTWLGALGTLLVFVSLVSARRVRLPWQHSTKLLPDQLPSAPRAAWRRVGARSYLIFSWVRVLLREGAKAPLRPSGLLPLWPSESVEGVMEVVQPLWDRMLRERAAQRPSGGGGGGGGGGDGGGGGGGGRGGHGGLRLVPIFAAVCGRSFGLMALCRLVGDMATLAQPICLQCFLAHFATSGDPTLLTGVGWGVLLVAMQLVAAVANNHMYFLGERIGLRCRGALSSLLYRKALRLSCAARRPLLGDVPLPTLSQWCAPSLPPSPLPAGAPRDGSSRPTATSATRPTRWPSTCGGSPTSHRTRTTPGRRCCRCFYPPSPPHSPFRCFYLSPPVGCSHPSPSSRRLPLHCGRSSS